MEIYEHHTGVEKSQHSPWWCIILLMATIFSDTYGQTVTVSMSNAHSVVSTNTATLVCDYEVDDSTYALRNVVWRKGITILAHFFGGAADPTYSDYCSPLSGPCTITRDSTSSQFVLSPVDFDRDNGNDYECEVTYNKGPDTVDDKATATLTIIIPTNTIVMSNGSSSEAFTEGSEVELSLDVANHTFQCVVAGINPQATFTWTVDGNQLTSDITESHDVDGTGLTTSKSNATLTPKRDYDGLDLICKAVNYEGDPGVMFRLVLKVADPCDGVECKNGGTCVIDQNDPSMTECECPDGYDGKLCETDTEKTTPPMRSLTTGAIVGIACAGLVLMVGTCVLVYCCCCGNKRKSDKPKEPHGDHESNTPMDTK